MGLRREFDQAVKAIDEIDFNGGGSEVISVFETTIRYLGGFLSAYDLTKGKYPSLLRKAVELGDILYFAFDTPNHLPIARWKLREARSRSIQQVASNATFVAEIGSLTLEFTRLSQLTGNPKYYDAVQRVTDVFADQQDATNLPGMWPTTVDVSAGDFTAGDSFTIGAKADSLYEYFPKVSNNAVRGICVLARSTSLTSLLFFSFCFARSTSFLVVPHNSTVTCTSKRSRR